MRDPGISVRHVAAPVRDQVVQNLRRAIRELRFQPGQRLIERELVELTGASRTSVREALRELTAEGLVQTIPHKGSIVYNPTVEEAEELYGIRSRLEALAVERFVERATARQMGQLKRACEAVQRASGIREMLDAKDAFYRVLGSCSPIVYSLLSTLHARISVLRGLSLSGPGRFDQSRREIRELVQAIETGDVEEAVRLSIEHVRSAGKLALRALADHRDLKDGMAQEAD